jgi:hypothetical protein
LRPSKSKSLSGSRSRHRQGARTATATAGRSESRCRKITPDRHGRNAEACGWNGYQVQEEHISDGHERRDFDTDFDSDLGSETKKPGAVLAPTGVERGFVSLT